MQVFKVSEEQYRKFRRRMLTIFVPGIAIMITVSWFNLLIIAVTSNSPSANPPPTPAV
ncbi:MAG TPA: hypothetical protein VMH27_10070 [Puia sp.]|nr:hypothetical protein [Puia sp.]